MGIMTVGDFFYTHQDGNSVCFALASLQGRSEAGRGWYGGSQYSLLMCLRVLESVWMAPTCVLYTEASLALGAGGTRGDWVPVSGEHQQNSSFRRKPHGL